MLIVGLGNPGKDYKGTRHNVGFEVIDRLASEFGIRVNKFKFKGEYGEGIIAGKKVMLVKPCTFMNLSGECVSAFMRYYGIGEDKLLVIFDDISLNVGELRVRERGSAGGHNGMKNIIQNLGTQEFCRLRIGIGDKPQHMDLADYVLSHFKKDEIENVAGSIVKASDAVREILLNGTEAAMNKFNQRNTKNASDE